MKSMQTEAMRGTRTYRAHVRLQIAASVVVASALIAIDAPVWGLAVAGGALTLLWAVLVAVRLRDDDDHDGDGGVPHRHPDRASSSAISA